MRVWHFAHIGLLLLMTAVTGVSSFTSTTLLAVPQLLHPMPGTPAAKDFKLSNLDGESVRLSSFRGKVVMVNFWATWCPPCRQEIPSMQSAWNILRKKDVMILAVHVGGNEDKVWEFLGELDVTFPVLMDKSSAVARAWPMTGLPVSFIIDPQGRIALRAIGGREWDEPGLIEQVLSLRK